MCKNHLFVTICDIKICVAIFDTGSIVVRGNIFSINIFEKVKKTYVLPLSFHHTLTFQEFSSASPRYRDTTWQLQPRCLIRDSNY